MRAVRYHEHGGPEVLRVEDVERPEPRAGELLVAVEAAGVNPVDTYFREGSYEPGAMPMIPGSDVAGVVDAVGPGVDDFAVGDRVFATGLGRNHQGTYAEYVVSPTDRVAHLPEGVTVAEGAAVGVAGVTAFRALVDHAHLEPAETCLIHGGSGGVGHVAVQLADAVGAEVFATARPTYADRLAALGADRVFDYRVDDLAGAVQAAGEPTVVLDHRLDEYLQFDATVAAVGARVVGIGNEGPAAGFDDVAAARAKEITLTLMSMFNTPDLRAVLERVGALVADGRIVPDVAETYPLEEAAEAQRAMMTESFFGKLLLEP